MLTTSAGRYSEGDAEESPDDAVLLRSWNSWFEFRASIGGTASERDRTRNGSLGRQDADLAPGNAVRAQRAVLACRMTTDADSPSSGMCGMIC